MAVTWESEAKEKILPKKTGTKEQVLLTIKVLLIGGGTLGTLALLEWIVRP